jgi:hypothetical protein
LPRCAGTLLHTITSRSSSSSSSSRLWFKLPLCAQVHQSVAGTHCGVILLFVLPVGQFARPARSAAGDCSVEATSANIRIGGGRYAVSTHKGNRTACQITRCCMLVCVLGGGGESEAPKACVVAGCARGPARRNFSTGAGRSRSKACA